MAAAVAEGGVRQIGAEDPDGDHQLIHGDHAAAGIFGAISDRYSGAVYDATPTARPSSTRETSSTSTFSGSREQSEPSDEQDQRRSSGSFRPRRKESQLLPTAPTATPNIMELTTHS